MHRQRSVLLAAFNYHRPCVSQLPAQDADGRSEIISTALPFGTIQ